MLNLLVLTPASAIAETNNYKASIYHLIRTYSPLFKIFLLLTLYVYSRLIYSPTCHIIQKGIDEPQVHYLSLHPKIAVTVGHINSS